MTNNLIDMQKMKQKVQFLSVLMALTLLGAANAGAVVDPYEALSVTPDQGVVESLQHFTITFDGLSVVVSNTAVPTLQKGGGATVAGRMSASDDGLSVVVDFDECYTASGQYFLNLPEGSITVNGQQLLPLTLRFTIEGSVASFYEQITIDPSEGEVGSLQNFVISLPQYVGDIEYGSVASLTNVTTGATYHADLIGVEYNVLVYFPDEVTEAGDYTLTIPSGSIIVYTLGEDVHELNFSFTIPSGDDFLLGDVDGDGRVTIADVTTLIDYLLSRTGEMSQAADVDGSGSINIADVTALIDLILTKG